MAGGGDVGCWGKLWHETSRPYIVPTSFSLYCFSQRKHDWVAGVRVFLLEGFYDVTGALLKKDG